MSLDDLITEADRLHAVVTHIEERLNQRYRHGAKIQWTEPGDDGRASLVTLRYHRTGKTFILVVAAEHGETQLHSAPVRYRTSAIAHLRELIETLRNEQNEAAELLGAATDEATQLLADLDRGWPDGMSQP